MNALAADNVTATFFYIGKRALVRPDIVKEAINRGFDVEDHSFTHSYSVDSSYSRLAFELNSTSYLLSQVGGKNISLYRPPYLLGIRDRPDHQPLHSDLAGHGVVPATGLLAGRLGHRLKRLAREHSGGSARRPQARLGTFAQRAHRPLS